MKTGFALGQGLRALGRSASRQLSRRLRPVFRRRRDGPRFRFRDIPYPGEAGRLLGLPAHSRQYPDAPDQASGPDRSLRVRIDRPIRVEPKGNRQFAKEDSLWYFYAVWNPKMPEQTASPTPAPPQGAPPAPGAPAAPAPAEAKPRIQARIGVLKDGQPAFAPLTAPAEMQPLAPGYFATGSEIPLQTFEPGYYTFTLTVRDLNAPKRFRGLQGDRPKRGLRRPEARRLDPRKDRPKTRRQTKAPRQEVMRTSAPAF